MQFKANLFLTVLAILVFGLLLSLGNWQLNRAQQKQDILDLQAKRMNLEPVSLSTVQLDDKTLRYLPVSTTGWLDTSQQILVDNQVKQGRVGYFVLTPLKLKTGGSILVNRGWVALGLDRATLPAIGLPAAEVFVVGKLDHFPSVGIKLDGADELTLEWPAVTQVIEPSKIEKRLGYAVHPYQLLLDKDDANGYDRDWVPMKMGPEKHHGYAFQWFALATAWVVIYFVLTVKKGIKKNG